jgi:hypothetical protein
LDAIEYERQLIEEGTHPLLVQLTEDLDKDLFAKQRSAALIFEASLDELDRQKAADDFYAFAQWQVCASGHPTGSF